MIFTFLLLALSICALWLPSVEIGRSQSVQPGWLLLAATIAHGLFSGVLEAVALLGVLALLACCWVERHKGIPFPFVVAARLLAVVLTLGLALHLFPGFHRLEIVAALTISQASIPYVLSLGFDKPVAGMLILACFCSRATGIKAIATALATALPIAVLTCSVTLLAGVLSGYVNWDPKLPHFTPAFLAINLVFTCAAEEAFFRGVLLEQLDSLFRRFNQHCATYLAIGVSSAAYGLAHYGGGLKLMAIATVSGAGCAWAYIANKRYIEAPVLVHFSLNTAHFLLFTYPRA